MLDKISLFFNNFFLSLASLARVALQSKWNIPPLPTQTRKSIIILGNGPSFETTVKKYHSILSNNTLMAVNVFCQSEYYEQLKPAYYIILANNFFYPDKDTPPSVIVTRNNTFSHLVQKTSWPCTLFVPSIAKKSNSFLDLMRQNPNIQLAFYNNIAVEGFQTLSFPLYDWGMGMPRPHNVIIPGIINSIRMGFKQIILVGADHSWLPEISVNEDNVALVHQKHFYDENTSRPEAMIHSIERSRKLHEILHKFYLSFRGYWEIRDYASHKNVYIYNSSEHSFIDAFERKKLNEIFD